MKNFQLYTRIIYMFRMLEALNFILFLGTFHHLLPQAFDEKELPESVKIKPVAKIVVSPEVMRAFIKVLHDNYEKFGESENG